MKNFKAYSDEGLLKLLKQQELGAFEEIYFRYWKKLYSSAYKRVQSREISEELVQDIFASLWLNRQVQQIEILSSYLFTAIKYKVINHLEKEMSRRAYVDAQVLSIHSSDNSTEEAVLLNELNTALEKEIQKLPPKRQQIFKMSRQENLSIKQVASHLGISEKTAENQLGKALKVLKVNLKHFNFFMLVVAIS
jgi:RNA polymerase sigma-70 factor (ECF subfamily)